MTPLSSHQPLGRVHHTPIAAYPLILKVEHPNDTLYKLAKHFTTAECSSQENAAKAAHYYALAALSGNTKALGDLGSMYALGIGVDQNDRTAIDLLRAAAQKGDTVAKYNFGVMVATGRGIEQDMEEAAYLFQSSANDGDPIAQFTLGTLYEKGIGVRHNVDEAIHLYNEAAKQGVGTALDSKGTQSADTMEAPC